MSPNFVASIALSFSQNAEPTINFGNNNFESQMNSPQNLLDISGIQREKKKIKKDNSTDKMTKKRKKKRKEDEKKGKREICQKNLT